MNRVYWKGTGEGSDVGAHTTGVYVLCLDLYKVYLFWNCALINVIIPCQDFGNLLLWYTQVSTLTLKVTRFLFD